MSITLYGLKNCDTCRKARKWLAAEGMDHSFVDVRADGVSAEQIARWAAAAGWETLLNKRGTTFRGLSDAEKQVDTEAQAVALMAAHPALIKRPVIEAGSQISVGWTEAVQSALKSP